ncbi:hypothetical protein HYV81_05180 [Candidatus Woesearchaeota archaeon]|nr:hypothetical protein [Candidatus Woesearchaeota archaeon]
MRIDAQDIDGFLANAYLKQLAEAYHRLGGRKAAKMQLDEHLAALKKQPKLSSRHVHELKKKVGMLIEKERMILHPDNRYIAADEHNTRHKEMHKMEHTLALLEKRYYGLRKKNVKGLAMKKIEAKLEFLRTKLAFLKQ